MHCALSYFYKTLSNIIHTRPSIPHARLSTHAVAYRTGHPTPHKKPHILRPGQGQKTQIVNIAPFKPIELYIVHATPYPSLHPLVGVDRQGAERSFGRLHERSTRHHAVLAHCTATPSLSASAVEAKLRTLHSHPSRLLMGPWGLF